MENGKWITAIVTPGREVKLAKELNEILRKNLIPNAYESFTPYEVVKGKNENNLEKPLYGGYIFIKCSQVGAIENYIKNTDGFFSIIKDRHGKVQYASNNEIGKLLRNKNTNDTFLDIFEGDMEIIVKEGAFSGQVARFIKYNDENRTTATIAVKLFGKENEIEVDINHIKFK